jgi:hypothetical protein
MEAPGVCEGPFNSCADILAVLERGTKESTVALLSQLLARRAPRMHTPHLQPPPQHISEEPVPR